MARGLCVEGSDRIAFNEIVEDDAKIELAKI